MRRLLDGLFHVARTDRPPVAPPAATAGIPALARGYFRTFLAAGAREGLRHHLVPMPREREGREPSPTAAIPGTQSAETTGKGGRAATTMRPRGSKAANVTSRSTPRVSRSASSSLPPTPGMPTVRAIPSGG